MLTTGRVSLSTPPRGRPTPPGPTPRVEWCQTPLDAEPARIRAMGLNVHLVDGTYELFRYHFPPGNRDPEVGAPRGVVGTCLMLLEQGAPHVGVAPAHVFEPGRASCRGRVWNNGTISWVDV